jgi:hypothetical protein
MTRLPVPPAAPLTWNQKIHEAPEFQALGPTPRTVHLLTQHITDTHSLVADWHDLRHHVNYRYCPVFTVHAQRPPHWEA